MRAADSLGSASGDKFIDAGGIPGGNGAGLAGDGGSDGVGEAGGLLDGPAPDDAVKEGRGEGVASADGIGHFDREAGKGLESAFGQDGASFATESDADGGNAMGGGPFAAEAFKRKSAERVEVAVQQLRLGVI